jgi:hypothetical protein
MIHLSFFFSLLLLSGWLPSISQSFLVLRQPACFQRTILHAKVATSSHKKEKEEEEDVPQEVSDAEALLACYAFLKRRKRIGAGNWTQMERRQRMKAVAQPHYFWEEDLSKIASRLQKEMQGEPSSSGSRRMIMGSGNDDEEDSLEGDGGETRMRPSRTNSAAEVWSGEFTSFPTDPSPTRMRRSLAAKQTWSDPSFRDRWYQRRWVNKVKNKDPDLLEDMALEQQIKALPSGFLGSPELCSMTEAEISMAIQTYLTKTKKQITSRKKTLEMRKEMLQQQMEHVLSGNTTDASVDDPATLSSRLSRDSLFSPDATTLQENQRKRSQRAKQIYKKRLEKSGLSNQDSKNQVQAAKSTTKHLPQGSTPQDAMVRIVSNLDAGILPSVEDVEIIMKPGKIGKRREVLRKILSNHFDLRGKCVPSSSSSSSLSDGELEFVTKCAIDDLGAFVMDLIRKEKRKQKVLDNKTTRNDVTG